MSARTVLVGPPYNTMYNAMQLIFPSIVTDMNPRIAQKFSFESSFLGGTA